MAAVHLPVGCLPHLHLLSQEEQQRLHHDVHNEQIQNGETLKSKWTQSVAQRRAGGTSGVISASLAVRGNEKRFRYHHILITDSTYSSYLWQLFKQTCWLLSAWFGLSAFGGAARFAFPWQHGDPLEGVNLNWFNKTWADPYGPRRNLLYKKLPQWYLEISFLMFKSLLVW